MRPVYRIHVETPDERGRFLVTCPGYFQWLSLDEVKARLAKGDVVRPA